MSARSAWGRWLIFVGLLLLAPVLQAQTVEYIHTDALGTPIAVTDVNRVVIERSEYEPYGKLLNRPLTDGPGFTGHVQDAATGMTYMQQRYYDPVIGRFLSVDPVVANPNNGALFNRYMYAANNPYRFYDPDGRCTGSRIINPNGTCASTGGFTTMSSSAGPRKGQGMLAHNGRDGAGAPATRSGKTNPLPSEVGAWAKSADPKEKAKAIRGALKGHNIDASGATFEVSTYPSETASAEVAVNGRVRLFPRAFRSSSWLSATLGHELEGHDDAYGNSDMGLLKSEVRAWRYSRDNAGRFGNSTEEKGEIDHALNYYENCLASGKC